MEEGTTKKNQKKRKSAGVSDIFEIGDGDLSSEPEDTVDEEPEAKVFKARHSDVSESRKIIEEHNHNVTDEITKNQKNDLNFVDGSVSVDETVAGGENADETFLEPLHVLPKELLEDGEVNDNISEENPSVEVPEPCITIKFKDSLTAEMYKEKFCKFIQSFIEFEVEDVDSTTLGVVKDLSLDPQEWVVLDETVCLEQSTSLTKDMVETEEELAQSLPITPQNQKKKKKKKNQAKFTVDTNPSLVTQKSVEMKYSTKFLIDDENLENKTKGISRPVPSSLCFNCDNEHSLRDCPYPKNMQKINANRQKYNKAKNSRYHLEEDQRFCHLQPGKVSEQLRKALNLKKNQIPRYIYQMRVEGYPPGWLEEAKVVDSDLVMFDIDGNHVRNTNPNKIKGLDPDKVVSYPGFNVPLEKGFKDEHKYYQLPPYSEDFSKKNMIEHFKKQCVQEEDNLETEDMDLDYTNDLSTVDIIKEISETNEIQNKQLESIMDSDSYTVPSPSLKELEKAKNSLLEELRKRDETLPWDCPSEDTSMSETPVQNETNAHCTEKGNNGPDTEVQIISEPKSEAVEIENVTENELNLTLSPSNAVNSIKTSFTGTPILKTSSPYQRLPNPDNFSKGVSAVIDFENLPNSTGKYEQMTGVLQKVRNTLKKLNETKS